jgi:5-methylcytosine-specific restriction endonuclease McrA
MAISKEVRQQVRERAKYLCEYCHFSEEASAARFEIDHIQPRSLGGADTFENLALACQRCNSYRYNFTEGTDPESQCKLFSISQVYRIVGSCGAY